MKIMTKVLCMGREGPLNNKRKHRGCECSHYYLLPTSDNSFTFRYL